MRKGRHGALPPKKDPNDALRAAGRRVPCATKQQGRQGWLNKHKMSVAETLELTMQGTLQSAPLTRATQGASKALHPPEQLQGSALKAVP